LKRKRSAAAFQCFGYLAGVIGGKMSESRQILMQHNSDTGALKIYSAFSGECILDIAQINIPLSHELEKAIRRAETAAVKGTERRVISDLKVAIERIAR
jgi:hypothetical protein